MYNSESDETAALFGRIDAGVVNYALKNLVDLGGSQKFYLCGARRNDYDCQYGFKSKKGVETSQILFELFTTSAVESTSSTSTKEGDSEITILVDEEETTFTMPSKTNYSRSSPV